MPTHEVLCSTTAGLAWFGFWIWVTNIIEAGVCLIRCIARLCWTFLDQLSCIVLHCFILFSIVLHVKIDIWGADGTESARHESPDQARDMDMKTQQATAPSPKRHIVLSRRCYKAIEGRLRQAPLNRSGPCHAMLNACHCVFCSSIHLASRLGIWQDFPLMTIFRKYVIVKQFFVSKAVPNKVKHFIVFECFWQFNPIAYNVTRHCVCVLYQSYPTRQWRKLNK